MEKLVQLFANRYPLLWVLVTDKLRMTLWGVAALALGLFVSVQTYVFLTSDGLYTFYGLVIGGDFVVFDAVADAAAAGQSSFGALTSVYEGDTISQMLTARYPDAESNFLLYWQYPPTMFFLVIGLAFLPYLNGYAVWTAGAGAVYFLTLNTVWKDRLAIALAIACPITFQAFITGQTGFITAALITLAALFAGKRPFIAGIAAGLLTIKPQLGLLIPLAFAAAGCWRAFVVAAVTALSLAGASVIAFGLEPWIAFLDAMGAQGDRLNSHVFPFRKLVTIFGASAYLGAPIIVANILQAAMTLALAAFVIVVWRKVDDHDLRAAALIVAAPLASPYAFYYEMPIFAPAILLIAKQAMEKGWLPGEKLALAILWGACFFAPGPAEEMGLPMAFLVANGALWVVGRRALPAAGVRFARQASPALQGS